MTTEYIKQKLIGLGLVLDDKEVTIDKKQVFKYNKLGLVLLFLMMSIGMYFIENFYPEIHHSIESFFSLLLFDN